MAGRITPDDASRRVVHLKLTVIDGVLIVSFKAL